MVYKAEINNRGGSAALITRLSYIHKIGTKFRQLAVVSRYSPLAD
jgi:hypothetical protein